MRPYLILTLLLFCTQTFAQKYYSDSAGAAFSLAKSNHFDHLSSKDGLSQNSVNCILQDREGYLWFGTNDGLNKFDGYKFTVIQADLTRPRQSLQSNQISGLCEDRRGRLWAVTEGGGLHEINKKTGQVTPHPIKTTGTGRWNSQHSIYEDRQGGLWLGTFGGLARYDPDSHRFSLYSSPRPDTPVKTMFEDRQHRFWVATLRGLYLFDRATGRFTLVPAPVNNVLQPTFISFYLDAQDRLWLGTAGYGLFQIDLRRNPAQLIAYNPGGQINPYIYLNSVHQDAAGIIWVGTTNGLQRIDPVHRQVYTYRPDPNNRTGISSTNAQAVFHDRAGTLWVGTDNGIDHSVAPGKPFLTYQIIPNASAINLAANRARALMVDSLGRLWFTNERTVYRLNLQTNRLENLPPEPDQTRSYIHTLFPDGSRGMWVGTWNNLYHLDYATDKYVKHPSDSVHAELVSQQKNGPLWIVGEGGIASFNSRTRRYTYHLYKPGDTTGLPDKYMAGLVISRTGDVWVLVSRHGVCRLNPETGKFTRYTAGGDGSLNSNDVRAIYEDDRGIIWVGTHQGGLNWFDPRTKRFSAITTRNGLPSNSIVAITSDQAGRIWLSTNKGICRFDPITKTVFSYGNDDNLSGSTFLENTAFRHRDRIFFGSLNGVVYFSPDAISSDRHSFPVYITGLRVVDRARPLPDSTLVLQHDENFLSFEFAALTYLSANKNQYAYQLVGVDKGWVRNTGQRFVTYPNLSPGEYTFRVKAANSDGIWSRKGALVQVTIRPPWWETWWAYVFYVVALIGGMVWAARFYANRIRQRQETEQLRKLDEMKNRFFSNITHELRTPLSLIIGPVDSLLQDKQFDASARQRLGYIQGNASKLLHLINQLLDLSKLEADSMPVSLMRGDVAEFAGQLVASFRQMADQKQVSLTYLAEEPMPDVLFDVDKWGKVLMNLVSNAVKFTGVGGHVSVSLAPISPSVTEPLYRVQLLVTDTGIGISPEKLPHIFDRFYQADDSRTRAYEGTGIGLALVKELVELMQGSVSVESKLNEGTRFTVILPVEPAVNSSADMWQSDQQKLQFINTAVESPAPAFTPAAQENGQEKPVILVVEDNEEARHFLESELVGSYTVLLAADGMQGWQIAQEELPDIVISDVMMPKMDGYELTEKIKTHSDTSHIAVVLLTAKAAQDSKIAGLKKGADVYVTKPFQMEEIQLQLRNLLERQQNLRQFYHQQLANPDTPFTSGEVKDPFLQEFYKLLDDNLANTSLNVDWLADQLAVSRKTLHRKISTLTKVEAPGELVRHYRLRKGADLLLAGKSVTEASELVGFKAVTHFTKNFKAFYHQTPTEYIEKRKGNPEMTV